MPDSFAPRGPPSVRLARSVAAPVDEQSVRMPATPLSILRDLNSSVEDLTDRVSSSVVQILVTGYGPVDT